MEFGRDKMPIKKVGQWSSDTVEGYFLQKRLGWVYFKGYYEVIEVGWLKIHY